MPKGGYDVLLEYDGYYRGGMWADFNAEEKPLELPDDHPTADSGDDSAVGTTGGDGADPAASGGGNDGDPPSPPVAVPASGVRPSCRPRKKSTMLMKLKVPSRSCCGR